MDEFSWNDLESFVRKEACMSPKKSITEETTVVYDLGQHGDDANEFMEIFFTKFKIDRGDYDFSRYFFMEGEGLISHLFVKYIKRNPHSLKREVMTVGMLYKALVSGRWSCDALSENKMY
ncbi:hypothetical protein GCM10027093_46500 [Paraburkholderia jirisanensis]